jgi:hypothetical protein
VLENEDFVKWANENIVVVVGHNDTGHEAVVEDAKGKKSPGCALYPGLQCKEHADIMNTVGSPAEGLPKIEMPNGVPNSWLVAPDGTVEAIPGADQQSAGKVQELAEAMQKTAGKAILWKDYEKLNDAFAAGAKAVEAGDWKVAVAQYVAVEKKAAKMPASVAKRLKERVEALNAKVVEAFEAVKAETDATQRDKEMKALRAKVSSKIGPAALPVLADIDAWLKANPLPKAAPTPK